ncbi:MAG: CoA transferase [Dehalococcoidia bacterium]|nr:CoA transferase [Dehalococcoidia bacterium]MDW8119250.1 CoA transferase [Chloroflexota bacterium]
MRERQTLLPVSFGPLQGVRILSTGTWIAQPFAATLAAEMGAEVVQIERPGEGDEACRVQPDGLLLPTRQGGRVGCIFLQDRRCVFYVTLNFAHPKGRDLFLRLVPHFDIWMESSRPGTYAKYGLDDATVLRQNPRLVIVHVSGFGQNGHPDYIGRPSYDLIGQAFGGLMHLTGPPPPEPPTRAAPWTGDYITALFALWSALAGYIYARRTGVGQSIDLAQYEAVHRCLAGTMVAYFQGGGIRQRRGNRAGELQPYDAFHAADGMVVIAVANYSLFTKLCRVIGLHKDEQWMRTAHHHPDSEIGMEFDAHLRAWVIQRPALEVERILNAQGIPCCRIMNAQDMAEDPHYQARGVHITWEDLQVGPIRGIGVVPHFSKTPGRVWRGTAPTGYDNTTVYGRLLGLSPQDIEALQKEGVV